MDEAKVTITQADLDAAADYLAMAEQLAPGGNDAAAIRNGSVLTDFAPFVESVARHRIAAQREAWEEAAKVVDQCNQDGPYLAIGAATAIRSLIGGNDAVG